MDRQWRLQPADASDWQIFSAQAAKEGWRIPVKEMALWRGPLQHGVLALRYAKRFAGLITLVGYGVGAWIGNLLVMPEMRGRGFGAGLLDAGISQLTGQGVRTLWLTASKAGLPLYQRRGFKTVGAVERWIRPALGGTLIKTAPLRGKPCAAADLLQEDVRVWGERRALLDFLLPEGELLQAADHRALLQQEPGMHILGPWFAPPAREKEARALLVSALAVACPSKELVVEMREGALPAPVLETFGLVRQSGTRLMCQGDAGGVDLSRLMAFASLGSMG